MADTLRTILHNAIAQLQNSPSAGLDAEILLAFVLKKPRSYLFTWPEASLTSAKRNQYDALIQRRIAGEPIAYLTGNKEFWSLNLHVSQNTLIPRPETELLVETILGLTDVHQNLTILDLGTGSGCIAVALAQERPHAHVLACDISASALAIAQKNAIMHNLKNIHFLQSDWFNNIPASKFDIIISNPPYLEEDSIYLQQGDIRFEPQIALISGSDGLNAIRHICMHAKNHLNPSGYLALELGYNQNAVVMTLLAENMYSNIRSIADLSGHDRVCIAQASC